MKRKQRLRRGLRSDIARGACVARLKARTKWKYAPRPAFIFSGRRSGVRLSCAYPEKARGVGSPVGAQAYAVTLTDPKRLRGEQSADASLDGTVKIVAPMPGKVVRVLVEAGAEVEAGAGVVVVEAMKMQNEMKSPKAGKVTSINVTTGATVNAGDVLAVVE